MQDLVKEAFSPITDKLSNAVIASNGMNIHWRRVARLGIWTLVIIIGLWRLVLPDVDVTKINSLPWTAGFNSTNTTGLVNATAPTVTPIVDDRHFDLETQRCRQGLADIFDRFQVVLKTGAIEEKDRLPKHLNSVTRCIHNLLIFSDVTSRTKDGFKIHDALAYLPQDLMQADNPDYAYYSQQKELIAKNERKSLDWGKGGKLDRFKFLPMVYASWRMRPNAPWYIFIETDTYVFWDGMLRLLGKLDPLKPHYIGSPIHSSQPGENAWYAYGGSGFVLSQGAMRKLFAGRGGDYPFFSHPKWITRMKKDFYGESILGSALHDVNVTLTGMYPSFFPQNMEVIPFGPAPNGFWCEPAITMHKILFDHEYNNMNPFDLGHKNPILFETIFNSLNPHKQGSPKLLVDNTSLDPPFDTIKGLSVQNCQAACMRDRICLQWLHHDEACFLFSTASKGSYRVVAAAPDNGRKIVKASGNYTSGWIENKIKKQLVKKLRCRQPNWLESSTERHWSGY